MSLIYDYLKINGKGDAGKKSKIEIPPALLKGESPGSSNKKSFILLLGTCFIVGILVLSIYKIHSTRQELQLLAGEEVFPANVEAVLTYETVAPPAKPSSVEHAAAGYDRSLPPSVDFSLPLQAPTQEVVQVFPEPEVHEPPAVIPAAVRILPQAEKIAAAEQKTIKPSVKPAESPVRQAKLQSGSNLQLYDPAKPQNALGSKSNKYYQAGLQAQQGGDLRIAEIFYQKALADSPGHMNAMINLSAIYVQQERYREAEAILWDILGVDRSNSKALVNLGVINLYEGKNKKAEEYFLRALQANPREENGLVNLVYLAEQKKDYAAAEMYYKQLLQISPANLELLLAYGYMLEQQYRYPEAMAVYQESLDLDGVRKNRELFARIMERHNQIAREVRDSKQ
ncbi:MAG: tetratricopeptide repeat protein [Deltaproteobacteria bacterium]|nr:tetratricopeptide repeat protein [Deltaproteobacteria bacterium]